MITKINELLNILRPDVNKTHIKPSSGNISSLEHLFPDVKWVYFLDNNKVDFSYKRVNDEEFEVIESLYSPDEEDYAPFLDNVEMISTIKQSLEDGDYTLKVQKTLAGYDLILTEVKNIREEYFNSIKYFDNDVDIYKNSNYFEINKLLKNISKDFRELRGLVPVSLENKNYYLWKAIDANHDDVAQSLGLKMHDYFRITVFNNSGGGKLKAVFLDGADEYTEEYLGKTFFAENSKAEVEFTENYGDDMYEEWVGSVKSTWHQEPVFVDVFKNPSKYEINKMTKGGKEPVRFFIDTLGDLFVWDFKGAMHDEVAQELKLGYGVKGAYYNPSYVEFFKVKNPESIYHKIKHSRLMNVLDKDFNDNLLREKLVLGVPVSKLT